MWRVVAKDGNGHVVWVMDGLTSEDQCDYEAGNHEEQLHGFQVSYEEY